MTIIKFIVMCVAKRWRDVTLFLAYVENNNDNDESKLFGKRIFMNDLVFFPICYAL